ncbi:ATP-binding cassette domain-containing protein [Micromonospora sp. NPDC049366]|uniref:ATP-binding cassette domain-containing protein n=1 Tax=Micromonospora sp. NPDC049366 TaxID=3364271 RepID=UPI00379CAA59
MHRPDAMQRLLYRAVWDADGVRDDLRQLVTGRFGAPDAVLAVAETGDPRARDRPPGLGWLLVVVAVVVGALLLVLRTGRDDEARLRASGHRVAAHLAGTHVAAGAIAGGAGSLLVAQQYVSLADFAFDASALLLLGVVIDGTASVGGALTAAEHLVLAAAPWRAATSGGEGWTVTRILDLLPRLAVRLRHRGDQLSGGEQQMLAIARALLGQPRVLLLDEPCEGLAPDLADRVRGLVGGMAATGLTVLLVEQQLHHAIEVADRVAVLEYGRLVYDRPTTEARADPAALAEMLSIATVATPPAPGSAAGLRAATPQVPRPPSEG